MSKFNACYSAARANNAALQGSVTLTYTVNADGTVGSGALMNAPTMSDATMLSCIGQVAKAMRFPAASASWSLRYPISFAP
jgi:hypothetical protein